MCIKKDIFCYQEYKFLINSISFFKKDMLELYGKDETALKSFYERCDMMIDKIEQYIYNPEYNDRYYSSEYEN